MDTRAKNIAKEWEQNGTIQTIREKSGWWVECGLPITTIEWLRRNHPEAFKKTDYFLSLNDYLAFFLTGNFVTNPTCAGEMLLVNSKTCDWDDGLCAIVGISRDKLSRIQPAEAVIGYLAQPLLMKLGLSNSIPVINGGQDHTLEALAVGLTSEGKAFLACGTAWVINSTSKSCDLSTIPPNMGLNFHIVDGQWIISQYLGCFGGIMEWWTKQMWKSPSTQETRGEIYQKVNESLLKQDYATDELFYLPFSGGKQLDLVRDSGELLGTNLSHTKEHFTYAIMEGIAFEVRWCLEELTNYDFTISELWMIGGAVRSSIWPQILADVLGIPIIISNYTHGPALGAAMIAAVSMGDFPNYEDCRDTFRIESRKLEPNLKKHRALEKKFKIFKNTSEKMSKIAKTI
jgi:sugar (pentulose or hexulose) kinase